MTVRVVVTSTGCTSFEPMSSAGIGEDDCMTQLLADSTASPAPRAEYVFEG